MIPSMGMLLALLLATAGAGLGHPGHGSTVVIGTLRTVTPAAIVLEVRDVATGAVRHVRVQVTADTKYREGRTPVHDLAPYIGTRAVAAVEYEEGPSGETVYLATEVRLSKPKAK